METATRYVEALRVHRNVDPDIYLADDDTARLDVITRVLHGALSRVGR